MTEDFGYTSTYIGAEVHDVYFADGKRWKAPERVVFHFKDDSFEATPEQLYRALKRLVEEVDA